MARQRRIETPKIVQSPSGVSHTVFILLVLVAFAAAIVGAFSVGKRFRVGEVLQPSTECTRTCENMSEGGSGTLALEVANLKQESIALKQSQQIDREANHNLSKQLKKAQDERLALEKEVFFLRRLIQESSRGILQPKDLKLEETSKRGEFRYNFTVRQLIQDFGRSEGQVEMQVIGWRDGKATILAIDKLTGSKPLKHKMGFKHFQSFQGSIKIPDDFEPEELVIEVKPKTAHLSPVSETFPWSVE